MAIHDEVLKVARQCCEARGAWTFALQEVLRALPHLNERSVQTHVVSRCCINAPKNHPHKWPYFRRISRGKYEIAAGYRHDAGTSKTKEPVTIASRSGRIDEAKTAYVVSKEPGLQTAIHAVVCQIEDAYVAECLEVAVVTQGRTLAESIENLRQAVGLHLEDEDLESLGLSNVTRLSITCELVLA